MFNINVELLHLTFLQEKMTPWERKEFDKDEGRKRDSVKEVEGAPRVE